MATPEPEPDAPELASLEEELAGAKLGELRKRAEALGVEPATLEARMNDAEDPKGAVVQMILAASGATRPGAVAPQPEPEPEPEPEPQVARVPGRAVGTLKTLAFVIGVKGYTAITPLDNSLHDADDFADLLKRIGFERVLKLTDETQEGLVTKTLMKKLRRELLKELTGMGPANTVVVFFFAGHGAEYDGKQYLLPQDWAADAGVNDTPRALPDEAMELQETLAQIEEKNPLATLAFLDCCREHVEVRGGVFGPGGLSALPGPAGSLVMFAAGQGKMAADGREGARNGAFTAALLKHLGTPGLSLEQMAVNVRNDVKAQSNEDQEPEQHNRLNVAGLCLVPTAELEPEPAAGGGGLGPVPAAVAPKPRSKPLNPSGRWDVMISYTQRNPAAELLAAELFSSFEKRGKAVWLDVKMAKLNEAAMKEGVENCRCVLAIVTGPCVRADPAEGEEPEDNTYFKRPYCINELRWARAAKVPIQPVILAEDKKRIGDLLALAPKDLKDLGSVDFIHLDRSRPRYWDAGIEDILANVADLCGPEPEPESDQEPEPDLDPEPQGPLWTTCLDRPYVQKEVGWARDSDKKIIVIYEAEKHRPGYFDFDKARLKYKGTPFESLLESEAIPYQREAAETREMLKAIFKQAHGGAAVEAAAPALNAPGWWEFFLSQHQALGGDQGKTLHLLLEKEGKTTWYDKEMQDHREAAMEEGVRHSKYFVLFLTAEPDLVTRRPPTAEEAEASWVYVAHRGTSVGEARAEALRRQLAFPTRVGTVQDTPADAKAMVCLLTSDEAPFEQISEDEDPVRLALANAFGGASEQVVIPLVDKDFQADSLEGLLDDIRSLARQLFIPIDWDEMTSGVDSLTKCLGHISSTEVSPVLRTYLSSLVAQTETFKDPCTQEHIHTETQCVPLKLLTVSELEESRFKSTKQIDDADRLLLRRRAGFGSTIGYGDVRHLDASERQQVYEAEVHFAEARVDHGQHPAAQSLMTVSAIVGPAASGKTTLLDRTTCGYAKDALRGCPGAMVPYIVRVMALSRWLIKSDKALSRATFLEYILQKECGGDDEGLLYHELEASFRDGKPALIFDGLDEAGTRLDEIATFLAKSLGTSYTGRMIISSREVLFDEQLFVGDRFQMLQIQPLTEAMQDDVLRRRFADSADVEAFKAQQATSENLKEMATNPLLLALQIGVFMLDDKQLPELRTELYEKGVRLLLRRVESGTTGARNVKAVAAAVSTPGSKRRPTRFDKRVETLMRVLCRMGHLLHIENKIRQFDLGLVYETLEEADLGDLPRDVAIESWEDLLQDGRGIIMWRDQRPAADDGRAGAGRGRGPGQGMGAAALARQADLRRRRRHRHEGVGWGAYLPGGARGGGPRRRGGGLCAGGGGRGAAQGGRRRLALVRRTRFALSSMR